MDYTELLSHIDESLAMIAKLCEVIYAGIFIVGCTYLVLLFVRFVIKTVKKRKEYKERCAKYDE